MPRKTAISEHAWPLTLLAMAALAPGGTVAAQNPLPDQEYRSLLAERDRLARDARVLEAETRLAQQKRVYLVADLRSGALILKVHGMVVKEFHPVEIRRMGRLDCTTGVAVLEQFEEATPTSAVAAPGASETEASVEITDMPQSFQLGFRAGEQITSFSIRPALGTPVSRAWQRISAAFASGGSAAMQAVGFKSPSYRLTLLPDDARELFWALEKGTPAILLCD